MKAAASISRNLWKLYLLRMGTGAVFYFGILIVFFQAHGFSFFQIFLYNATGNLVQAAWQIPSGYLADRWNRRSVVITGCTLNILGLTCYCISPTFPAFMLGAVFIGTGFSFLSGTLEALTFESLAALGKQKEFRRAIGMQNFLRFGTETIASILGGLLALWTMSATFWFTLPPFILMLGIAFTLTEPKRTLPPRPSHLKDIWRITRYALIDTPALRSLLLFDSFLIAFCLSLYFFTQPYQRLAGIAVPLFGPLHGLVVGIGATASAFAHRIEKHVDDRIVLGSLALTSVVCYLALGAIVTVWGLIFIILMRVVWSLLTPLTYDLVNRLAPSDMRATVLSIKSMGAQILWALIPLSVSMIADHSSLQTALSFLGIAGCLILVPLFLLLLSHWKHIPRL